MKIRLCDKCSKTIEKGQDYYKVCLVEHKDKRQLLNHQADLCKDCLRL